MTELNGPDGIDEPNGTDTIDETDDSPNLDSTDAPADSGNGTAETTEIEVTRTTGTTETTETAGTTGTLRRAFLRTTAATGAVVGLGSVSAQDEDADADADDPDFRLDGRTSGWIGVEPEAIDGERNPTLDLEVGEDYVLVWENDDGAGHNFVIEDEDGEEEFLATEVISGVGETQTVEFTAEEGMAEYFCGPHPQSMRGEIAFEDEDVDGAEAEEPEDEEPVEEFAAVVDEIYEFTLDGDGWHLDGPEELVDEGSENGDNGADDEDAENAETDENEGGDETNPTLELQEGNAYVITWSNELDGAVDEVGADEDVDDDEVEVEVETDEDADADADAETENGVEDADDGEPDDEDDEEDDENADEGGNGDTETAELVLVVDDDQEFIRSGETEPGESSAVTFAAPSGLEAYRDEATGAEGEILVEPDDEEDDVEDLFLEPPFDDEDEGDEQNETDDANGENEENGANDEDEENGTNDEDGTDD